MKRFLLAGAAVLLPGAVVTLAADVKPFDAKVGLWEATTVTEMQGMPEVKVPQIPPETLAKMPPAQRAQVEAMLKNAGSAGAPRTTVSKSCTTKESLSRGDLGAPENKESNCTRQVISSTSSKIQMHIECSPARGGKSVGDVTMERIDSEHVKSNMVMKIDSNGRTIDMKMTTSSKWLSADCGDVKPYIPK